MTNSALQSSLDLAVEPHEGDATFVLRELEVFNWGPFSGMHRASIDPRGTAVIGPTGSGKTTLIDALMTLLVAQPRYNLASTGGHESDRTLISYVRGVLGGDGNGEVERIARPGKTITGLCATYRNGSEMLRLAGILWTDGAGNSAQDLHRRWIFSQVEEDTLEHWLRLVHEDGVRHLMSHGRETGRLRIFDSKKAYLAHMKKFFDVGDNAFNLLNRAAGLKQLNSINEIFRDLVLDDLSAFDRALEVATEFDDLAGIHAELETARRQRDSLVPIEKENAKLTKTRASEANWLVLKRILPKWFATLGEKLWADEVESLTRQRDEAVQQRTVREREQTACRSRVDTLREQYLQLGGNIIGELENTIRAEKLRVDECRKQARQYLGFAEQLGLETELSEVAFARNVARLAENRETLEKQREEKNTQAMEVFARRKQIRDQLSELEETIRQVEARPGSNIPPRLQNFRSDLAQRLSLAEDALPFVAEMVEVKREESAWRGAIERAIGSERLRVLVPEPRMKAALRWINDRDNRVHVRLQMAGRDRRPADFFPDGFTRKLNFKNHPLSETVKSLLAARDRHCVDSPEALEHTEFGLTVAGTMSDKQGRFEKQDQKELGADWMTGFDNRDQMRTLRDEMEKVRAHNAQWEETASEHQRELTRLDQQIRLVDRLVELEYPTIDLPGSEAALASSEARLRAMIDPTSDVSRAKSEFDSENSRLEDLGKEISELISRIAVFESQISTAEKRRQQAREMIGEGLTDAHTELAREKIHLPDDLTTENLTIAEARERQRVDAKLESCQQRVQKLAERLVRLMEGAQRTDTGALSESGTELIDIPDYLERLRVLTEEALPEKLKRFLDYLNRSSDQGVTQLLARIGEEVDAIELRIGELNHTLAKVDFRDGRYLQLQPQRIRHERLRSLDAAQRHLRSAALRDDQGESHYRALRAVIDILREAGENRRQLGSRALLDPRYRLDFYVVEVDRKSGERSAPRSGSQSGSGGEKELMASHILTASLSYALCPVESGRPLYGTIVLDEAFSKSSPSAAGRIIEALRIFGLHPIFVTPNKEIGLLKKHTRKVICVQRPEKNATLASISWEKLEELHSNASA